MRSAQFGVYSSALATIQSNYGAVDPSRYWFGCVNPQVVAAGFCGGIGRGLVEGPFEMAKVRNQGKSIRISLAHCSNSCSALTRMIENLQLYPDGGLAMPSRASGRRWFAIRSYLPVLQSTWMFSNSN